MLTRPSGSVLRTTLAFVKRLHALVLVTGISAPAEGFRDLRQVSQYQYRADR